ncbi:MULTISPECIES: glycosyltransferase family 4 protein [Ensifer]|uniref:Glycosyltransferase family 4 protein n=1 Tax=Ensifer adhaerens TaxID=106592 RepID=A0ABY8HL74_ENSAD|nr:MULTISPECIES: glycosyltransferase family 4 protein [Ensifer]MBD9543070.1 glycosyltransferase family 4 protein [Ensifer sp. ENS04]ANK72426.1 glycosyl transferase family 1 [Ensifer adhaerens]KDP75592.1 glycosyl transferase family 1 [Ensifer adhaerens]KQX21761.1 glycosyl transferase family 1 [Ensifer sp. Root423]KQZ41915.1 glycosyl transferase family 1 [Ensifer sp. Root558]
MADIRNVEVIAPNFKRRLSGVTSTIIQLIPIQRALGEKIAVLGPGLPDTLPSIRFRDLLRLWSAPDGRPCRVWHARRNVEMLPAIVLRDLLGMKLRIVFTSASQRRHTGWSKFLISRMDAVIATSGKTAAYLQVPNTVILHGIDTKRFQPPVDTAAAKAALGLDPNQKYVGCFGRVRKQKGTDLFVDSMIGLLPCRPGWSAIVAGRATGPHVAFENELKERVAKAGLTDRIRFVGEHTNIPDWYRGLDLFIAPQRWEGFGLTPLEAMATGVPVIATDVGAFSELVVVGEQETGAVIAANDLQAMVEATAGFMDDDHRRTLAGANGLGLTRASFAIEGEARAINAVYERLMRP